MKLIRQIIVGLALLAVFIVLSVFSTTEYTEEKTNLSDTEDKLPIANIVLSKLSDFLSYTDRIPILNLLPAAKVGADFETETAKDIYNKIEDVSKNNPNIKEEIPDKLVNATSNTIKNTNWMDLVNKIRETLSKDWFRP